MRKILSFFMVLALLAAVFSFNIQFNASNSAVVSAADPAVMTINSELNLTHPRRGECLTVVGGKIWVTGGLSYVSHFTQWGKGRFQPFVGYPNMEIIDPVANKVTYTKIGAGKDFYKSIAFTVSDTDTTIYIAAKDLLGKVDTVKQTWTLIKDFGEKGGRTKGTWGRMTIKGKNYVVVVGEDKSISFFDATVEKFVKIDGVINKLPVGAAMGGVINNKYYIFGGNAGGDESGGNGAFVFDPNIADPKAQLKPLADLPIPLSYENVAVLDGKVYIMGGGSDGDFMKTVFEYDPATNNYIRKTDLPRPLNNGGSTVLGDKIYIAYGYSWGTQAEGKLGFRIHPEFVVAYQPKLDKANLSLAGKESVTGKYMNISLTWPDANKISGANEQVAISWLANTASSKGLLYYRVKGAPKYTEMVAKGNQYSIALTEGKGYRVILDGLKPGMEYEYYVVSDGKEPIKSTVYTFKTQPLVAPKTFQVFAYGDSKAEYHVTNEINGFMTQQIQESRKAGLNPAFLLQLGDFGAMGNFSEYEAWFNYGFKENYTQKLLATFPFVAIHGNHENQLPTFYNSFSAPKTAVGTWPNLNNKGKEEKWYSFNYGSAHFIVLQTGIYPDEVWYTRTQLDWLKRELSYSKAMKDMGKIKWVVLLTHNTMFTSGEHFIDVDAALLHNPAGSYVDAIEESEAVDVVLMAHDHDYERSKNIKGYRYTINKDGKPTYVKLANAFAEEGSERFGEATQGKGTIYVTIGTAGAGQRDMYDRSKLGDSSWIAARKPEPDRGESIATSPIFGYGVLTFSDTELKFEMIEKSVSYLPDMIDDTFEGLVDRVTIYRK